MSSTEHEGRGMKLLTPEQLMQVRNEVAEWALPVKEAWISGDLLEGLENAMTELRSGTIDTANQKLGTSIANMIMDEAHMPGKVRLMMQYQEKHPDEPVYKALAFAHSETERLRGRNFLRRDFEDKIKEIANAFEPNDPLIDILNGSKEIMIDRVLALYHFQHRRNGGARMLDRLMDETLTDVINKAADMRESWMQTLRPYTMTDALARSPIRHRTTVGYRIVQNAFMRYRG